jgi:hypothetical protein
MIYEILAEHFEESKRVPRKHDTVYPTQSSTFITHKKYKKLEGKCMRASYYNCMGVQEAEDVSVKSSLIFKIGDYTEEMLLDILKKKELLDDSQTKFYNEKYGISGRVDGIFNYNGRRIGLEIKSIGGNNDWTNNQIWGSKWNDPFPKWQNLFQTLIYLYAFKDEIDEFVLLYIRRDICEIKEFLISLQPKNKKIYACIDGKIDERFCIDDILERYKILREYVAEKKLPPREYSKVYNPSDIKTYVSLGVISKRQGEKFTSEPFGDFECRYCGYSEMCDRNDPGEIEDDSQHKQD